MKFFDYSKPAIIESDASDFAVSGVLSQYDDSNILRPVAFFSSQLLAAQINYDTADKELLAIVECFKAWRHYLMAADPANPTLVLSDHANLELFTSAHQLSPVSMG